LLLFIYCVLFPKRTQSYWPLALAIFLLANTSIYGVMIAIVLVLTLVCEIWLDQELRRTLAIKRVNIAISILIAISGIVISILQIKPPADGLVVGHDLIKKIDWGLFKLSIVTISTSYLPIPNFLVDPCWNTNLLVKLLMTNSTGGHYDLLLVLFSLALFLFSIFLLARKTIALLLYFFGTVGMLLFINFVYYGEARHHGHLFIFLIVCLWLSVHCREMVIAPIKYLTDYVERGRSSFLLIILSIQLAAGALIFVLDLQRSFSTIEEAASFISRQPDTLLAGSPNYRVCCLSGFLDKKIYYPESNSFATFIVWKNSYKRIDDPQEVLNRVRQLSLQTNKEITLVLNYQIYISDGRSSVPLSRTWLDPEQRISISALTNFTDTTVAEGENYYLYLIKHER
ncbi:MAG: hypothetical protein AB1489_27445, partial [Acidobacteriota bacterium]